MIQRYVHLTGKSFSEALIPESTNPQYDKRLFMELPWNLQAQNLAEQKYYLDKM